MPFRKRVAELTGKPVSDVTNDDFDPQLLQSYLEHYRRAFSWEAFSTVRKQTGASGLTTYQQLSFNPIYDQQEVIWVNCFMRDITEQQEYVERIEDQNNSLREIAWMQSYQVRAPLANVLGPFAGYGKQPRRANRRSAPRWHAAAAVLHKAKTPG